jgi:hypothetical protein
MAEETSKKTLYYKNIEESSAKIEEYFAGKGKDKLKAILDVSPPEVKIMVYNRTSYPILYDLSEFFYIGGDNMYMVLKSKTMLKETPNKVRYYEAFASEADISLGKSPVIPIGCSTSDLNNKVYPKGTESLMKTLV